MFLHRIKIVTLAGFTVWIDASWLILAALLTWTLALGVFARATRVAAGAGQFFGLALILFGGWQFVTANSLTAYGYS